MPQIRTITTYNFDELSEAAKQKALEKLADINTDFDDWHNFIFEDAKMIADRIGIDITNIYFSGFSSQGDGACFEGSYKYRQNSAALVKEYAPQDTELHRIASELAEIQRRNFYKIKATVKHSGRYYHSLCTYIDVFTSENAAAQVKDSGEICELLRAFMQWIYGQLEKEFNYRQSKEAIIATIRANNYEFKENGDFPVCL